MEKLIQIDEPLPTLLNKVDIKSKSDNRLSDQTYKQARQIEKSPSIICAGCDMV